MIIQPQATVLKDILSRVTDPVTFLDHNLNFIFVNKAYSDYMGIDQEQLLSMQIKDVIPSEYETALYSRFRAITAENPGFDNIYPSVLPTGEIIVEKWHNSGVFNENGELQYYYCVANLKDDDEQLFSQNKTNIISSTLIRSTFFGILVTIENNIIYINSKFWEILGIDRTEFDGNTELNTFIRKLFPSAADSILDTAAQEVDENLEMEFDHPDGHDCWLSVVRREQTINGRTAELLIIEDISERKLNEIETEIARKRLSDMMRIAKVGYWEKDLDHNRWIWSDETYDIYDLPRGTLITDDIIMSALNPSTARTRNKRIDEILHSKTEAGSQSFEYPIHAGTEKQKWLAGEAFYEKKNANDERRFFGWVQDISERKKIEHELLSAKEKAEESERLKSTFLANMSHEIRTPLNAILGFSDLLTRTDSSDDQQKFKSIIIQSSNLLLKIIDDILDFSSIESGSLDLFIEPLRVDMLFKDMDNIFSGKRPEEVKLRISVPSSELSVSADRERLKQVMINLINNAYKYTKKGSIDIGCTGGPDDRELTFYIKDTGIGIEPEQLDSIFDRFYQADSFSKGTGLGLAITRSIIDQMGGRISVNSKPGKGSEFIFTLPAAK